MNSNGISPRSSPSPAVQPPQKKRRIEDISPHPTPGSRPSTPSRSLSQSPQDDPTPARARLTQHDSSQYGAVSAEASRRTLFSDYPKVHQVLLDEMISGYLPDPPGFDELCKQLIDQKVVGDIKADSRWTIPQGFISPAAQTGCGCEPQVFLQDLYSKIMDHYKTVPTSLSSALSSRSRVVSEIQPNGDRYNTTIPDGAFLIGTDIREASEKSLKYDYLLMVCPMEFRKIDEKKKELEVFSKIMWSMRRIMRSDPHRRFVFGLTMEDTNIRFWFHDRATVVASQPFHLHKDWRKLVQIFIAFGTADRVNLGFDDTVSLTEIKDGNECVFDITVFSEDETPATYRTIERPADHSTDVLTGRGTRVWKVEGQLVGKDLILKDSWINDDRTLEHFASQDIWKSLSSTGDPRLRHFLTCVQAGQVPQAARTKGGGTVYDHTFHVIRRGGRFSQQSALNLLPDIMNPYVAEGQRDNEMSDINSNHRVHHRIVIEEVGYPLTKLSKWDEILFALQGVLSVLGALHAVGYIHRDVSVNNILLVKRNRDRPCKCPAGPTHPSIPVEAGYELVPVVMDLEYSLKVGDVETPHNARPGTWEFMATEVVRGDWLLPEQLIYDGFMAPPFRQHALHDIEPILWTTIWLLFKFIPPGTELEKDKLLKKFCEIFPPPGSKNRVYDVQNPTAFAMTLGSVLPKVYTPFTTHIQQWMLALRKNTGEAYINCAPENLDIVKIGEGWSASAVKLSTDVLENMRQVVREDQVLQQSLKIVDREVF